MMLNKTRISITALLATMGIASALPAVSQAKPHRTAKPVVSHTQLVTGAARRIGTGPLGGGLLHVPPRNVVMALQAGSAGIPGYGDAQCEGLANNLNKAVDEVEQGLLTGDEHRTNLYGELANRIYAQMSDNCLVVD